MAKQRHFYILLACGLLLAQQVLCQSDSTRTDEPSKINGTVTDVKHSSVTEASSGDIEKFTTAKEIAETTEKNTEPNATTPESQTTSSPVSTTKPTAGPSSEPTTGPSSKPTTESSSETTIGGNATTGGTSEPTETTEPTKTTEPATTTGPPKPPPPGTWELKDTNNTVCLKLQINITFVNNNNSVKVDLEKNATVSSKSSCSNDTEILILEWSNFTVEFNFKLKNDDQKKYYLYSLEMKNTTLPDQPVDHFLNGSGTDYLTAHKDKAYMCVTSETKSMSNDMKITWSDVKVQAFMTTKEAGNFGEAEDCSQDNTSDVVPIAVGCALAALVLVVLIAYLVGRRRSRQKGYQSV